MSGPSEPARRGPVVAVVVVREGRIPAGSDEAVAEADGQAVLVGSGTEEAAAGLGSAAQVWWATTGTGPHELAARLAGPLSDVRLVLLPASPDGRDLAPRLAANMGRPLLAGAVRAGVGSERPARRSPGAGPVIHAELLRVDGRVVVPVECTTPAVATLLPAARSPAPRHAPPIVSPLDLGEPGHSSDPEVLGLIEPDPATMDLADATRVLGGGAGLVPPGADAHHARMILALLGEVAARLGASMGATRVVTDAGWAGHQRQIGTTGVAIHPELYVAFGVSGATQHTSGLGSPAHIVSVNTDPSCPMTAMADLGLVTHATTMLIGLAEQLGVEVPAELSSLGPSHSVGTPSVEVGGSRA